MARMPDEDLTKLMVTSSRETLTIIKSRSQGVPLNSRIMSSASYCVRQTGIYPAYNTEDTRTDYLNSIAMYHLGTMNVFL